MGCWRAHEHPRTCVEFSSHLALKLQSRPVAASRWGRVVPAARRRQGVCAVGCTLGHRVARSRWLVLSYRNQRRGEKLEAQFALRVAVPPATGKTSTHACRRAVAPSSCSRPLATLRVVVRGEQALAALYRTHERQHYTKHNHSVARRNPQLLSRPPAGAGTGAHPDPARLPPTIA